VKAKIGDISVAVMFVAIVLIIILPVPSGVLDILLALNISLAVVILLNVVYSKEPLQLSVFPSLLLFTTLYRLALNIKSTTLILAQGEAGEVIRDSETLLPREILWWCHNLLNHYHCSIPCNHKGTERVSEVAARFTLDAMPGKQMAIDAI